MEDPAAEDWDGSLGCGVREISAFVGVEGFTGGSETFDEGEAAGSEMEEDVWASLWTVCEGENGAGGTTDIAVDEAMCASVCTERASRWKVLKAKDIVGLELLRGD